MTPDAVSALVPQPALATVLAAAGSEALLATILTHLAVIVAAARAGGWLFGMLGQPPVVGEILAGLLLGPSALGRLAPGLLDEMTTGPGAVVITSLGQLGLIFLMFSVGLDFDTSHLRKTGGAALAVAFGGMVLPFALGAAAASTLHPAFGEGVPKTAFVLIVATALSITAIPILGRLLRDFDLVGTREGVLTMSAAAVDDAAGWALLAAVGTAVRGDFQIEPVVMTLAGTAAMIFVAAAIVRPVATRWLRGRELNDARFAGVLLLVLLAAWVSHRAGVFSVFGPFVLGASLSGIPGLAAAVRARLDPFVSALLLPAFFTFTGLRTDIGSLDSLTAGTAFLVFFAAATAGKVIGCGLPARLSGLTWRETGRVASLMNTRALMGLVAVNVGRDLGAVPDTVYTMLVLTAVATTVVTAPALRRLAEPVEVMAEDRRTPDPVATG